MYVRKKLDYVIASLSQGLVLVLYIETLETKDLKQVSTLLTYEYKSYDDK